MLRHYLLLALIVLFGLGACGGRQRARPDARLDDDAIAVAVAATLTALPTAIPYVIEVTRIVAVTPTASALAQAPATPTATAVGPLVTESTDFETAVIALVNAARQRNGLPPYHLAQELGQAARGHSTFMATTDQRSHVGAEGTTHWQRIQESGYSPADSAEEAIGWSFTTPQDVVTWWLDDPFHRPLLLSAHHTEIGVGYAFREEWDMHHYWVAVFGSRRTTAGSQPVTQSEPNRAEPMDEQAFAHPPLDQPAQSAPAATIPAICPATSNRRYTTIPMTGTDRNHPDALHGDWNLSLRGYTAITANPRLIEIAGPTDPAAPQLPAVFGPIGVPGWRATYRVNDWDWGCGVHGCQGRPLPEPEVTLLGIATSAQQPLYPPARAAEIYGGGYIAAVLYADAHQVTLAYTRDGSVAHGYSVHLANFCVDPNLVTAYQAADGNGRTHLPALRAGEQLGTTLAGELHIAIRDRDRFLDPRSRKDWW